MSSLNGAPPVSRRERKYTALFVGGEYYHVNCMSIFSGKAPPSATFTIPCGFNFLSFVQESFHGVRRDREECLHGRRRSGSTSSPANANLLTVNVSGMAASWGSVGRVCYCWECFKLSPSVPKQAIALPRQLHLRQLHYDNLQMRGGGVWTQNGNRRNLFIYE